MGRMIPQVELRAWSGDRVVIDMRDDVDSLMGLAAELIDLSAEALQTARASGLRIDEETAARVRERIADIRSALGELEPQSPPEEPPAGRLPQNRDPAEFKPSNVGIPARPRFPGPGRGPAGRGGPGSGST